MKKNLLLIGSTGFTGNYVLQRLLQEDVFNIHLFVRNLKKVKELGYDNLPVTLIEGDLDNTQSLKDALRNQDILINIASLGFGHAPQIIDSCPPSLQKAIFISTTGIFTKLNPKSKQIRINAEQKIQASHLNYTIIRPTMIFGSQKDRNMCRLIHYIKKYPIIPVFGNGTYLQQPIDVNDLAAFIVHCSLSNKSDKKIYNVAGQKPLSFNDMITTISQKLNKSIFKLHIPLWISIPIVKLYNSVSRSPKIKTEQLYRLNENKSFSYEDAQKDFNFTPLSFAMSIDRQIKGAS